MSTTVETICTKSVITIKPSDNLVKASELMFLHGISRLVVVEDEKPIGIITEKDIVTYLYERREKLPEEVKVEEVMSSPVITANISEGVEDVAKKMLEHGISSIVIVKDDKLVGIVTKHDMAKLIAKLKGHWRVSDFMTPSPITVRPSDTIFKAIRLMVENRIGRVVVVGPKGKPVGMVTLADISRALPELAFEKVKEKRIPKILRPLLLRSIFISSIMSKDVIVVRYDMDLADAAQVMITYGISGLPVVDSEGKLIGIITKTDMTRAVVKLKGLTIQA